MFTNRFAHCMSQPDKGNKGGHAREYAESDTPPVERVIFHQIEDELNGAPKGQ